MTREHGVSTLLGWIWGFATLAVILLVLLGSWYPFEWIPGQLDAAWQQWLAAIDRRQSSSDFAINVMLGVLLGFFGLLALVQPSIIAGVGAGCRGWRVAISAVLVLLLVFACAMVAELGQHWFRHRVPSARDTLAQEIGGCIGVVCACVGGAWFAQRLSRLLGGLGDTPLLALLDLYVACYTAWMLMPFVPCVSPSEIKQKWKSGMIQLSILAEWRSDVWQALYTAFITSISAMPIGFAFARFMRGGWLLACIGSVSFVVGLEALQVVIETRYAQASDAFWSAVGATAGATLHGFWARVDNTQHEEPNERYSSVGNYVAVVVVAGYLCIALLPFEWIGSKAELVERVSHLRVEVSKGMLAGNDMTNASNLLRTLLISIALGAAFGCIPFLSSTGRRVIAMGLAATFLAGICSAVELMQIFSARHSPSVLAMVVRLLGAWVGLAMSLSIVLRSRRMESSH